MELLIPWLQVRCSFDVPLPHLNNKVSFVQKTATRWSSANVNINLDDLGQLNKAQKSAAPTMKQLQQQSSTPHKGFTQLISTLVSKSISRAQISRHPWCPVVTKSLTEMSLVAIWIEAVDSSTPVDWRQRSSCCQKCYVCMERFVSKWSKWSYNTLDIGMQNTCTHCAGGFYGGQRMSRKA